MNRHMLSMAGIAVVVVAIGGLAYMGKKAEQAEAEDRERWEEVAKFRVALAQYRDVHGTFPQNGAQVKTASEKFDGLSTSYQYRPLPAGCTAACADYEVEFSLETGTGDHGKGEYRADRTVIKRVHE